MKSRMRFSQVFLVWTLFLGLSLGLSFSVNAEFISQSSQAKSQLWQTSANPRSEVQARTIGNSDVTNIPAYHSYENAQLVTLNENLMRNLLNLTSSGLNIGARSLGSSNTYEISMPMPNGTIIDLSLVKDSVLPDQLAAKFSDINTYRVLANDRVFSGKVDISASGFHAMLQMLDGEIVFIDPVKLNNSEYAIYNKSAQKSESHRQHSCGIDNERLAGNDLDGLLSSSIPSPSFSARELIQDGANGLAARTQDSLKSYTIAIATTGEYSAKFGGSVGATLAAIVTTLNRVNQVLERDLGIHLNLVENNDLLINADASSDPFTNTKLLDLVFQNQEFIDAIIGNANYDIGHLLTSSGGGLAAIASICNNGNKAKGASGISSPRGDSFDLDFVAHEIGHQLGATHTFNSSQGACSEETRTARTAFEPGSGSSIMSYAGYCGLDNIQSNTDAMYHIGSIKQIADYTNNGNGSSCGVVKSTQNTPPQVDAGRNFIIPARTPFELKGIAVDVDDDSLLYAWEQLDAGDTSTESLDKGNNALFRVHAPNSSSLRSFPPLKNVLNHKPAKGETLPNHERNLSLSFVAQDGFNPAQSDEMIVKVMRTGSRFALNYPRGHYARGSTSPIYWNVANTDKSPINCSSVNIWLSLDGGQNFNYAVAANIPNTGDALVTIPADVSTSANGRFKIKCSDNIFYAVSYRNFIIADSDNEITLQYLNEDQAETNLKDISLNSNPSTNSSSENATSFSNDSGGGLFDIIFYLLFIIFIKGLYSNRSRKNNMIRFSEKSYSLLKTEL